MVTENSAIFAIDDFHRNVFIFPTSYMVEIMNRMTTADEYSLIRECVKGNAEQYAILVERYKTMAYTIAYRMIGDADTANDMAQESFIAAYAGLKNFRYNAKFSSWLYRIVMNKCRDYLRSRKDSVPVDAISEFITGKEANPEQSAASREMTDVIQKALDALPGEYREVMVLRHIEDLRYEEIADILGENVSALRVRAHRGREMLKSILAKMGVTL
jgi:RNA polymerase sigma-70 factor (ECF subfamily)